MPSMGAKTVMLKLVPGKYNAYCTLHESVTFQPVRVTWPRRTFVRILPGRVMQRLSAPSRTIADGDDRNAFSRQAAQYVQHDGELRFGLNKDSAGWRSGLTRLP